jgi:hypothetical protein
MPAARSSTSAGATAEDASAASLRAVGEVGLYEIVRALIADEIRSEQAVAVGNRLAREAG